MEETRFEGPWWPAPAKLNLMLRIVGRRGDGYHLLQTVFQFLDHGDWLGFELRGDGRIRRRGELPGVAEEDDLVVRAAWLLREAAGGGRSGLPGVDIHLRKCLPMGGGLGGGSSDAATALLVLDRIWGLRFGRPRLAELGLALGADVPVFVHGFAAWAEGVGELLTPVEPPQSWYLVLLPPCQVATAEIFCDPDLTRDSPHIKIRDFLAGSEVNDCVAVVSRRYPEVERAMAWLAGHARPRLTGTGGCVFACFEREADARRVHALVPEAYRSFVARGLNRSPLLTALQAE
ncbi:MAG: 4-(cytidine 5'-diphospho)-2-C-methyl-D-erythritol kinase [Candidatus Sedimenticola endophacoides]